MKQIAIALHNYDDSYGSLPPVRLLDAQGVAQHSWRVLIMPYIDQLAWYESYRFDESWDGPNNRKLHGDTYGPFFCPTHHVDRRHDLRTSYVAVTGEHTVWREGEPRRLRDISDGLANTLLLMEVHTDFPWAAPKDISAERAIELLTSTDPAVASCHRAERFFVTLHTGRNVAMADGSIRHVLPGMPKEQALALLSTDGREVLPDELGGQEIEEIQWSNCYRLAIFVFLVLLPLPWVWLPRYDGQGNDLSQNLGASNDETISSSRRPDPLPADRSDLPGASEDGGEEATGPQT